MAGRRLSPGQARERGPADASSVLWDDTGRRPADGGGRCALLTRESDTVPGVNRDRLPERVYLVGFMGAGKTTVARALALLLGYDFLDTDSAVEETERRSIEELFRHRGEGYFREREWEILASTALRSRLVVATGGGLFLAPMHRSFIRRHGASVWLDVSLEETWSRCREVGGRPLFSTLEELDGLLEARRPRYTQADHRIDVSGRNVDEVAREIEERLSEPRVEEDSREEPAE